MRPNRSIRLELTDVAVSPQAELLEHRTLLSGSSALQHVGIDVPSAYISQQADQLTVTLVRSSGGGHSSSLGPLTVNFSAMEGSLGTGGVDVTSDVVPPQFTPVNQPVTFPRGVTSETVVVPIHSGAPNPGTVPMNLSVTSSSSSSHQVRRSDLTVYLASSPEAVPPSIIGVQRVAGGIAVTFSKPMDPTTVQNIHNYAVKFSPTQKFSLADLTGVGLIETLNNAKQSIALRRATYNASTNTVTLVANEQLGANGSYTISNPSESPCEDNRAEEGPCPDRSTRQSARGGGRGRCLLDHDQQGPSLRGSSAGALGRRLIPGRMSRVRSSSES